MRSWKEWRREKPVVDWDTDDIKIAIAKGGVPATPGVIVSRDGAGSIASVSVPGTLTSEQKEDLKRFFHAEGMSPGEAADVIDALTADDRRPVQVTAIPEDWGWGSTGDSSPPWSRDGSPALLCHGDTCGACGREGLASVVTIELEADNYEVAVKRLCDSCNAERIDVYRFHHYE